MSIAICTCKLNRFFRRQLLEHSINLDLTDDEFDDIDNAWSGCAFE